MTGSITTPLGLFSIDGLLSEEDLLIQKVVRDYVETHIKPKVANWYDKGEIPARELAKDFGSLGLLGMHLEGYGCSGTSALAYGLAAMELEAGDSGIRSLVSVQGSLAMFAIHEFGSEEQKEQWLPGMSTGEIIGCFGLTESDFGSNPQGMRTHARQEHDGLDADWILNGSKMWITNGSVADIAIVWAQTDKGIKGFIVPTDSAGFVANPIQKKMSLRASVTSELVFSDVRLPADSVLPLVQGLRGPLSCLNEARFGIMFGALGAARDCLDTTISYAINRLQFDRPIAGFQLTQQKLADMTLELGKGMLLALHMANLKDTVGIAPEQISLGKLNSAREALKIARTCRSILGGNGITLDYPIMRHMNNLESVFTYEGTHEMHTLVIGNALTGIPAFK